MRRGSSAAQEYRVPVNEEGEPAPLALTDIAELERAVRGEGYRIIVDPASGEIKLEKAIDR